MFLRRKRFWVHAFRRHRLHTKSYGGRNKPTVVLLHGMAGSGEDWAPLITLLTPHYRCITIDLLGFGKSPKSPEADYTTEQHVRLIRRAIKSQRISGPYILLGHSLGALIATNYARHYPGRIQQLVLLSPPVYPPLHSIDDVAVSLRTYMLLQAYKLLREHPCVTPVSIQLLGLLGILPDSIVSSSHLWDPLKHSLKWCVERQTLHEDIRFIRTPVTIFHGTLDRIVIGAHIRAVASSNDVRVRTFHGGHQFTPAYAREVSNWIKTMHLASASAS